MLLTKENIKVGNGCTVKNYTDREAYTIIEISESKQTAYIQRDKVTRLTDPIHEGFRVINNHQIEYTYEPDPEGNIFKIKANKDGQYYIPGHQVIIFDGRSEFYDYNF